MRELIASIEQRALPTPQNHRVAAGSAASFVLAGDLARQAAAGARRRWRARPSCASRSCSRWTNCCATATAATSCLRRWRLAGGGAHVGAAPPGRRPRGAGRGGRRSDAGRGADQCEPRTGGVASHSHPLVSSLHPVIAPHPSVAAAPLQLLGRSLRPSVAAHVGGPSWPTTWTVCVDGMGHGAVARVAACRWSTPTVWWTAARNCHDTDGHHPAQAKAKAAARPKWCLLIGLGCDGCLSCASN